jgi:DNA-directed RNA polymerase specialized sigma24 family protein
LFRAVPTGGDAAWHALLLELEPELVMMARRQPVGRLSDRDDTPREIVTRVLARLHAKDYATIRKLCALDPVPDLRAWLRVLVRRSAIDYMREQPEFDRGNVDRPPRWISLATLSSSEAPAVGPDSLAEKRKLVLDFVRESVERAAAEHESYGDDAFFRLALEWKIPRMQVRRLVVRGAQYVTVLTAVLEGASYPETAARLGLTRREVELTVRYLEELLQARGSADAPQGT